MQVSLNHYPVTTTLITQLGNSSLELFVQVHVGIFWQRW